MQHILVHQHRTQPARHSMPSHSHKPLVPFKVLTSDGYASCTLRSRLAPCLRQLAAAVSHALHRNITKCSSPAGAHDEAHICLAVQEQRLGVPVTRPVCVQVQQQADKERLPGLSVAVVAKVLAPRRLREAAGICNSRQT